jgi:molybdopterin converting factor small subunit
MNQQHRISIQLFGAFRRFHQGHIEINLPADSTAQSVKHALGEALQKINPEFRDIELLNKSALATTQRVLSDEEAIGSEKGFAILPPVCGG